jgi:isocitrate lyase
MDQLTKWGYVWQFITLDGIHSRVLAAGMDYRIYRDLEGKCK